MTIKDFYSDLVDNLPICAETVDFQKEIDETFGHYLENIRSLDPDCFDVASLKDVIIGEIENGINVLKQCVRFCFEGCPGKAFESFCGLFESDTNPLKDSIVKIEKDQIFYRARLNDGSIHSIKDMFHIPNNKRGIVKTQRFSMPGYPCLYLGNTVFDCWQEMGRPSFDDLMFSGFKTVCEFSLFDLRIPNVSDFSKEKLAKTLKRMVFVIACQFKVKETKAQFKPEYIIPQLLFEYVVSVNRKDKHDKCSPYEMVWGVIYTSTHNERDFSYGINQMENIVLPVVDINNEYCNYLASLFEISEPLCYRNEELKENMFSTTVEGETLCFNNYTKLTFMEKRIKMNASYKQLEYIMIDSSDIVSFPPEGGEIKIPMKSNASWKLNVAEGLECPD